MTKGEEADFRARANGYSTARRSQDAITLALRSSGSGVAPLARGVTGKIGGNLLGCGRLQGVIAQGEGGSMAYVGELAALAAALSWSIASMLFQRLGAAIDPLRLNCLKGVVASVLFGLTIHLGGVAPPELDRRTLLLIGSSGLVGITLGDTAFFKALNGLGSRRMLLLMTSVAPMTALIAMATLGETLTVQAIVGIFAVAGGIAWVISDRESDAGSSAGNLGRGLLWGAVAAMCQTVGVVLSRAALADTAISPLWSTVLRLVIGTWPLLLWEICQLRQRHQRRSWQAIAAQPQLLAAIGISALLGTYIAIWLQQTSVKFAPAGISQTLGSTSALFVLPLAALAGDRLNGRAIGGTAIAIVGVALLLLR